MFENTADLLSFILCGIAIDFFIFHYWRKDGDRFDGEDKHIKGNLSNYVNCCFCHGYAIGCLISPFFGNAFEDLNSTIIHIFSAGLIIAVSSLTYNQLVLKE